MVNNTELEKKIEGSSWDASIKHQILDLLPKLPPKVLDFLDRRLSKNDFELIKQEIYISIFDGAEAVEDLKQGKIENFVRFLQDASINPDYNFGVYLIPLVIEIRQQIQSGRLVEDARIRSAINSFELEVFDHLPEEEVKNLVNEDLLYFLPNLNMVEEIKKYYVVSNATADVDWNKDYLRNLQTNEEILGKSKISVDRKLVEPTVQNWITDYIISVPSEVSRRGAFDEIQYIKMSPNVKTLSPNEQTALLEILKLYNWLLNPRATLDEVEAYNSEKYQQPDLPPLRPAPDFFQTNRVASENFPTYVAKPQASNNGLGFGMAARPAVRRPPVVPQAPRVGMPVKMSDINNGSNLQIDEKLEELKRKVE